MSDYLLDGSHEFFSWCHDHDATATVCYASSCNELEIRVEIYGEFEFYRKRAIGFEETLIQMKEEYSLLRLSQDDKSKYEQQQVTITTLQGCLTHYKNEIAVLKAELDSIKRGRPG